jgi:hypothetical protein
MDVILDFLDTKCPEVRSFYISVWSIATIASVPKNIVLFGNSEICPFVGYSHNKTILLNIETSKFRSSVNF